MEAYVDPTLGQDPLPARRSDKVSSGPPPSRMQRHSSPGARRVSSIQESFINQLKPFKPFLSPGPSRSGGSTYWALSPMLSGALSTCCWKYALEAIIKALLLYFLIHDN